MRIVFMGTPDFAVTTLQALIEAGYEVAAAVSQPDKPFGRKAELRPTPVRAAAEAAGIPVLQPRRLRDPEFTEKLEQLAPDVIVVAAYGKIIPGFILELPKYGCLNVHASLLPKYRGAAPIQWAVINGEVTTGVTIMRMEEGLDTGAILLQKSLVIGEHETAGELFDRVAALGAEALTEALEKLDALEPIPQDDAKATYAPMLQKSDGAIDWSADAAAIDARIRGVTPWPGAYTTCRGKRLKIHKARPVNRCGETGKTVESDGLIVACGHGAIELLEVQPEGGRRMSAADFARGQRLTAEDRFG